MQTVNNFCGLEVQKLPGFSPWGLQNLLAGETTFVETDCATYRPLNGWKFQDAYDVSSPPDIQDDYTKFWLETSKAGAHSVNTKFTSCELARGTPMAFDCVTALSSIKDDLTSTYGRYVPSGPGSLNNTLAFNTVSRLTQFQDAFMFTY